MKYLKLFLITNIFLNFLVAPLYAANDDYDAVPPFLPTPVSPNILMVVDRSGSMTWSAYNPNASRAGFCWDTNGCGWTYTGTEEGYWVPGKNYKYTGSDWWDGGVWEESTAAVTPCPNYLPQVYNNNNTYAGSCLNFHLMTRLDLLRWAMTGGRPDACTDGEYVSSDCDPVLQCTGTDCILHNMYNMRVKVPSTRIADSIISQYSSATLRPRFGLLFYSDSLRAQKVYVGDYPYSSTDASGADNADPTLPFTYVSRLLNAMSANNATGTAPAMWEAYDYFKQNDDHPFANDFEMADTSDTSTLFRDPLYVCDYDKTNCSLVGCAKNFVILATDGQWNIGGAGFSGTCTIDTGYEDNSADPVVPAHRMHYDLLRTVTSSSGNTFDKRVDAVFGLGLFLQGTGLTSLQNTAMYGGYDNVDGTIQWPGSLTGYPLSTCSMDDCGAGKGSACTPLPASSSDWDNDPVDNVPDTFVNASGGTAMRTAIKKLIDSATQRAAAGSSISVLSEKATSGSVIHQALFYPTKAFSSSYDVDWTGSLNAYWFYNTSTVNNIREDNANEFYLDTFDDHVLDFTIGTSGALTINFYDTDGVTGASNTKLGSYAGAEAINKIFESGEKLRDRAASGRVIYGINESGSMGTFTAANYTSFDDLLDPSSGQIGIDFDACLGSTSQARAENLIEYLRGAADSFTANTGTGDCRSRVVNASGDRWKLGDIIHSSPVVVPYANASMLYIASNDGMLHAFNAGAIRKDSLTSTQTVRLCEQSSGNCFTTGNSTSSNDIGKEAWAFIPKNVMPYLKYLADPDYQHLYTVDLSPYYIEFGSKKILIAGLRFGGATGCTYKQGGTTRWCGDPANDLQVVPPECSPTSPDCLGLSSYFALDVTDPANPVFLWEFTDPDLGFTFSGPAYIKRGGNSYVMFLNGPINYRGETAGDLNLVDGQDLKVFILKVDANFKLADVDNDGDVDRDDVFKFDGDGNNGFVKDSELANYNSGFGGRLFTNGVDFNNDGNTDLVFFGINDASGASGNVTALMPKNGIHVDSSVNYDPTDKVDNPGAETANWYFDNALQTAVSPITSKVVYGECFGSPYIYFGTGRWFYKADSPGINSNDVEELYGLKITDCLNSISAGGNCSINYAKNSNPICGEVNKSSMGWVVDTLEPRGGNYMKERTYTDPTMYGDIVSFTTMQPSSDPCDFSGRSRIWDVNCATGQSLWDSATCTGYTVTIPPGSHLLQLSGGNIEDSGIDQVDFPEKGNMATGWFTGIPPESATPFVPYSGVLTGEIILWIER